MNLFEERFVGSEADRPVLVCTDFMLLLAKA
jgi:hypothetical protein